MDDADEMRADILDAVALLTDSYSDEAAFDGKLMFKIASNGGDVEVTRKLVGLLGGMTVVTKMLVEYGVEAVGGDPDDDGLTDTVAAANNTTVLGNIREMTAVARAFVDFCVQRTGMPQEIFLSRLGEDMNWLDD